MLHQLFVFFLTMSIASSVHAGPWLREKGSTFTSTTVSTNYYLDTTSQTYLEYGLTENMTLIAELNVSRLRYAAEVGSATVSIRRALSGPDAKSKWAYELGLGIGWAGDQSKPHLRSGISWGRGMKWGDKSGWATVDASVVWDVIDAQQMAKVDGTIGVNFTDVTAGMLQLYTTHMDGQTSATFSPSLIFSPNISKFRILVSAETPLRNLENSAIKLGLWREF